MLNGRKPRIAAAIVLTLVVFTAFQNCAKTNFSSLASEGAESVSGAGGPDQTVPPNVPTPGVPTPSIPVVSDPIPVVPTPVIVPPVPPVVVPPVVPPPVMPPPPEPVACTPAEVSRTLNNVIQSSTVSPQAIADACADPVVSAAQSYPLNADNATRFFNTCGNRYCQQVLKGISGRVVEVGAGGATVVCAFEPTITVTKQCQNTITNQMIATPWIESKAVSRTTVAETCRDPAVPALADQYPTNAESTVRWTFACGNRQCAKLGYDAGRVIEDDGTTVYLECMHENIFNSLGGGTFVQDFSTTPQDIAAACVDGVAPFATAQDSLPNGDGLKLLRFMNTCGNRFCASKGFRLGRLIEMNGTAAVARCTR